MQLLPMKVKAITQMEEELIKVLEMFHYYALLNIFLMQLLARQSESNRIESGKGFHTFLDR